MPYEARRSSRIETLCFARARAKGPSLLRTVFSACAVATALLGCGGGGSSGADSSTGTPTTPNIPTPPATVAPNWPLPVPSGVASLSLLAGNMGGAGNLDGQGADARFSAPKGVALDKASGNLYVADTGNFTVRKVAPGGVVSTLAGQPGVTGYADGTGSTARFIKPTGVAFGGDGQIYVADGTALRRVSPSGVVTTLAGSGTEAGHLDASGAAARFVSITALAVDGQNNLWVADAQSLSGALCSDQYTSIRKVTPAGVVSTVTGKPGVDCTDTVDGLVGNALFGWVGGLAVDSTGSVYVLKNNGAKGVWSTLGRNTVQKISPAGIVSTLNLTFPGSTEADTLVIPSGLATDPSGGLLVATGEYCGSYQPNSGSYFCTANNAVLRIGADGIVTKLAGAGPHGAADGIGTAAGFFQPAGLVGDAAGNVFVADTGNNTLRKIAASGQVTTYAGAAGSVFANPGQPITVGGQGAAASFSHPKDMAVDAAGNALVVDWSAVRKVSPDGVVTDAGVGRRFYVGFGSAGFDQTSGLGFDREGALFQWVNSFAGSNKGSLLRTTVAGSVSTVLTAAIDSSYGVTDATVTPDGVAYTTDALNGVRKIQRDGSVSILSKTVLGHLIVDGAGNVYGTTLGQEVISGQSFSRPAHALLKISPAGEVSVLAGSSADAGFADGVGASARFNTPAGLALDGAGNLYVADSGNHAIRRITPSGVVTTVLGDPARQGIRAGGNAMASLNTPLGLAFSPQGPLLVTTDNAVMKLSWP